MNEDNKQEKQQSQKKLKPVIVECGQRYNYHQMDRYKQNLLLQAMQVTTDPEQMKKLAGLKTISEVHRTLDKMSMRKDYHQALAEQGLDLRNIVSGIKEISEKGDSDRVRLDGYKTLLKSIGLDEYKESMESTGESWEDLVRQVSQEEIDNNEEETEEYEVEKPEIPEEEGKRRDEEYQLGKSLYDE